MSVYRLDDALSQVLSEKSAKFNESVDIYLSLKVNPKVNQSVKGVFFMPHPSGANIRIAALLDIAVMPDGLEIRTNVDGIFSDIKNKNINFDVLIASPSFMKDLVPLAPILGPRGLMPSAKTGTMVDGDKVEACVQNILSRFSYTINKKGIVSGSIGRKSFSIDHLRENALYCLSNLRSCFPKNLGNFLIKGFHVSSTMGRTFKVDHSSY